MEREGRDATDRADGAEANVNGGPGRRTTSCAYGRSRVNVNFNVLDKGSE